MKGSTKEEVPLRENCWHSRLAYETKVGILLSFLCPFLKGFFLNPPYSNNPLSLKYITKWVWSYRGTEEVGEILRYGPALEQGKTIRLKITKCLCTLSSGKRVPYEESCNRLTFRGASSAGFTALCIYCTTSLRNICKNFTSANIYVYVVVHS